MFKMLSFCVDAGLSRFLHWSMASFVKIILFMIQLSASVLLSTWKPGSWYPTHIELLKHNESATE